MPPSSSTTRTRWSSTCGLLADFDRGHIIGAINIPSNGFANQLKNSEIKLKDAWDNNNQLNDRIKQLTKDNRNARRQANEYSLKATNAAVLKDRLMKDNAVMHYNLGVLHTKMEEYSSAFGERTLQVM